MSWGTELWVRCGLIMISTFGGFTGIFRQRRVSSSMMKTVASKWDACKMIMDSSSDYQFNMQIRSKHLKIDIVSFISYMYGYCICLTRDWTVCVSTIFFARIKTILSAVSKDGAQTQNQSEAAMCAVTTACHIDIFNFTRSYDTYTYIFPTYSTDLVHCLEIVG